MLRPWALELPDFVLREPARDGAFSGAWRDLLGHLGDESCCKATMSRQENDAVALRTAMASRRTHNVEVAGSNPAPSIKNLQLGDLTVSELFRIRATRGAISLSMIFSADGALSRRVLLLEECGHEITKSDA